MNTSITSGRCGVLGALRAQMGQAPPAFARPAARSLLHSSSRAGASSSSRGNYRSSSASFGAAGTLSAVSATVALLYFFSQPLRADAPPTTSAGLVLGVNSSPEAPTVKDAATGQALPRFLPYSSIATPLPGGNAGQLELLGLGVRTVSFLRVKVYVAALYVDMAKLDEVAKREGWKGALASKGSEELVGALLDAGVPCAVRIVPVRSTDFHHLRDGFVRSLQARSNAARKAGSLAAENDEAFSASIQDLKTVMTGRGALKSGSALDLILSAPPSSSAFSSPPPSSPAGGIVPGAKVVGRPATPLAISMEHEGKVVGRIDPPQGAAQAGWSVARQLLLAYFADKDEISKPFKASVLEGITQRFGEAQMGRA